MLPFPRLAGFWMQQVLEYDYTFYLERGPTVECNCDLPRLWIVSWGLGKAANCALHPNCVSVKQAFGIHIWTSHETLGGTRRS